MTPFALSGLLIGITSAGFGFFVFFHAPDRRVARTWLPLALSVAGWGFGGLWMSAARTPAEGALACRVAYAFGVLWIPVLCYHFVCVFLGLDRRRFIAAHYLVALLFLAILPTSLFFSRVERVFGSFYCGRAGALFPWFLAWWMGVMHHGYYELFCAYRRVPLIKKNQIKYFALGTAVGLAGGSLDYLLAFHLDVYPWGNFTICLYPVIMSYAITRYRLMDITIILRKTMTYTVVMGSLIAIYLVVVVAFTRLFQGLAGYNTVFSSLVAAGLVSVGFQPLRKRVEVFMDRKFFRQYVDREEKLYELSREVITHTSPEAMANSLVHVLGETLHPKFSAIYLKSHEGNGYAEVSQGGVAALPGWMPADNPLPAYFMEHPQPFVHETPAEGGVSRDTRRPCP